QRRHGSRAALRKRAIAIPALAEIALVQRAPAGAHDPVRAVWCALSHAASSHSWVRSLALTLASKRAELPTMAAKSSNINAAADLAEGTLMRSDVAPSPKPPFRKSYSAGPLPGMNT